MESVTRKRKERENERYIETNRNLIIFHLKIFFQRKNAATFVFAFATAHRTLLKATPKTFCYDQLKNK